MTKRLEEQMVIEQRSGMIPNGNSKNIKSTKLSSKSGNCLGIDLCFLSIPDLSVRHYNWVYIPHFHLICIIIDNSEDIAMRQRNV